jgi:hypothetical protein
MPDYPTFVEFTRLSNGKSVFVNPNLVRFVVESSSADVDDPSLVATKIWMDTTDFAEVKESLDIVITCLTNGGQTLARKTKG